MPDEDLVTLEVVDGPEDVSDESSASNPTDDVTQEQDTASPIEDSAAVDTDAPSVESLQETIARQQEEIQQRTAAYDAVEGQRRQYEQQVQGYQRAEEVALAEVRADKDKWLDIVSDPDRFAEYNQRVTALQVSKALQTRDSSMAAVQQQNDGMRGMNALRDFAINDAKMSEADLQAFLMQYRTIDPATGQRGQAFAGYPVDQAVEMAKSLIRDKHSEHFTKQQQAVADKEAKAKADNVIKTAFPSGAPPTEGGPKSYGDTYREAVTNLAKVSNPDNWV